MMGGTPAGNSGAVGAAEYSGLQWAAVGCSGFFSGRVPIFISRSRSNGLECDGHLGRWCHSLKPLKRHAQWTTSDTQQTTELGSPMRHLSPRGYARSAHQHNTCNRQRPLRISFDTRRTSKMSMRGMEHVRYEADGKRSRGRGRLVAGMGGKASKGSERQMGGHHINMDAGENLAMAPRAEGCLVVVGFR